MESHYTDEVEVEEEGQREQGEGSRPACVEVLSWQRA